MPYRYVIIIYKKNELNSKIYVNKIYLLGIYKNIY